ncbi:MAG: DUF4349 domain-containing protein [Stomatobaculum sp.]|nr:DUF4349 domain-containing protein [Stomatobaculum sp.]
MRLNRRMKETCAVLFSAALCALSLTACGSGGGLFGGNSSKSAGAGRYDYGMVAETAAASAMAEPVAYDTMGIDSGSMARAAEEKSSVQTSSQNVKEGRKLIRNVSMSIRLASDTELQNAVAKLTSITNQYGGFVVNNDMSFDRNYAGGSLTVQIPKDDVDTFLEAIRGTGYRITGINDSSRDVTSQYVDTEARIKVQEQKIENYQKYLQEAENVTDTLEISDRLNDAIADMESYKSTMKALNQQIDYTEIRINISCDAAVTQESFGERVSRTLRETGENFVDYLLEGLDWFAGAVAILIFALPVAWIVIRVLVTAFRAGRGAVRRKEAAAKETADNKERKGFLGFGKKNKKDTAAQNPQEVQETAAEDKPESGTDGK